jgi:hypothetical protein
MKLGDACGCGGKIGGLEYSYGSKYRYDGISERVCMSCNKRWGRWCEEELTGDEVEPPFCDGGPHPRVIIITPDAQA